MSTTRTLTKEDTVFRTLSPHIVKMKKVFLEEGPFIQARFIIPDVDVNDAVLRENVHKRTLGLIDGLPLNITIEPRMSSCLLVIQPTP